jgi:GTP cyclohydrolase-4
VIDVHAMLPAAGRFTLHKVGVTNIKKPLAVQRADRVVTLTATFEIAVDLPASRKGSDLSRNAILLAELVDSTVTRPVPSLESACVRIARELLARHTYATQAQVEASAEYFRSRGIAEERTSLENYLILAEARATRSNNGGEILVTQSIGAEAVGMTACPCAMETARETLAAEFPLLKDPSLKDLPIVTHNQRNRTRLILDVPETAEVEVDDLLDTVEEAQSSPTYAILKRGDEGRLVIQAHRHPKFVEDVIRDLLFRVPARFRALPDETVVRVQTLSEESIHKYNVVAGHQATLGELRQGTPA